MTKKLYLPLLVALVAVLTSCSSKMVNCLLTISQ